MTTEVTSDGISPDKAALVAMVVDAARAKSATGDVTLSNGIVLRAKSVPPALIRRVVRAVPEPPVPVVFLESKQREEENPFDPTYLIAVRAMHEARLLADQKVRMSLGTEIVSIPAGMSGPDDEGWVQQLRAIGVEPRIDDPTVRYIEWLELYAIQDHTDILNVANACYSKGGIFEPEVMAAIATFWSPAERGTDNDVAAPEPADDGDRVRDDGPGDGPGD